MKIVTLEETLDKYIGDISTAKRKNFEEELRLDVLGNSEHRGQSSSQDIL